MLKILLMVNYLQMAVLEKQVFILQDSNILLNIYMIPRFGLYGAIGSTTASFAAAICYLSLARRRVAR